MILKVGGRKREVGIDDVAKLQKAMFESNLSDNDQMLLDAIRDWNKKGMRLMSDNVPTLKDETEIPERRSTNRVSDYAAEFRKAIFVDLDDAVIALRKVADEIEEYNASGEGRRSMSVPLTALLGCPHCGEQPECTVLGSHIEIWCCAGMSRQKSDYLTLEERQTWDNDKLMHSDKAERKAFEAVAAEWNRRQPNKAFKEGK